MKSQSAVKLMLTLGVASLLWGCPPKPTDVQPDDTTTQPTSEPVVEKPVEVQKPQNDSYLVVRGDSLWKIAGKPDIYGNPYQWPLIYKANRDKINDADLIYPGQNLTIERGVSEADRQAAIDHAKTRGAWSVGTVEDSDKAYLNK